METYDETYDLSVIRGESFEMDITFCELIENVRVPIDLTGVTAKAEIRPMPGSKKLLASFDIEIIPVEGNVLLQLTREDTLNLQKGWYAWDLLMENANEALSKYILGGKFRVKNHVTEPI